MYSRHFFKDSSHIKVHCCCFSLKLINTVNLIKLAKKAHAIIFKTIVHTNKIALLLYDNIVDVVISRTARLHAEMFNGIV